tara:strand:+ start:1750 stop:1941 length:192 start_codon:yes stop_codon:yes gene_type:complete
MCGWVVAGTTIEDDAALLGSTLLGTVLGTAPLAFAVVLGRVLAWKEEEERKRSLGFCPVAALL